MFLPESYSEDESRSFPLVLFLHGSGERGSDLNKIRKHGPPKILENASDFPAIVVSPQCPEGETWAVAKLNTFLKGMAERYNVDRDRIYLTGLSLGGEGTWEFAWKHPEWFAAIAPICGKGNPRLIARHLKEMPIWTFHGVKDKTIPIDESIRIVRALQAVGKDVRFTVYQDVGHDSWTRAYENPALWDWLLAQRK